MSVDTIEKLNSDIEWIDPTIDCETDGPTVTQATTPLRADDSGSEKKVLHKRSGVEGKAPSVDQLDYGELAINYNAGNEQLYIKNSEGEVIGLRNNLYKLPILDIEKIDYVIGLFNGELVMADNPHKVYANVGDIAFYDSKIGKKKFVSYSDISAETYPIDRYVPIGVVVIPTIHNIYGTGECAVMSLMGMNYTTPDSGGNEEPMCWGCHSLLGTAYDTVVQVGTNDSPTTSASGTNSYPYMPSDTFTGTQCPTDSEVYYNNNSSSSASAPSPYLDGERNPVYYQTTDPTTEHNALSDFDGIGNTTLMLNAVTVSGWQTAESIENSYDSGHYPSAMCCWRYHTDGTSQGDWYLPACGELGYMMARLKTINNTINKLIEVYGVTIGYTLNTSTHYWGSSEESSSNARNINTTNGQVFYSLRDYDFAVRAFLRI